MPDYRHTAVFVSKSHPLALSALFYLYSEASHLLLHSTIVLLRLTKILAKIQYQMNE